MQSAGVILKTVERCNINCTYCYYFNSKDQSYLNRKPYISINYRVSWRRAINAK